MAGRSMSLDVLVRLKDALSGPLRRLRDNLRQLGSFARNMGALGAAIGAISFMGPMQEAAAFQQQLLDIAGTAELSGRKAWAFVEQARGQYEALALEVGQYSDTIAKGAGQMIAAGLDQGYIQQVIGDIGMASTAANAEFADMASIVQASALNLKVPAEEVRDVLGALVVAGKMGSFEAKDMARHFASLTPHLAKFGVKGREAVNFLGSALQIAMKGASDPAQAANNLKNFLSKALSPDTVKRFKEAGVDLQAVMMDAAVKGINPMEAMLQKVGKLTGVDQAAIGKYMAEAKKQGLEGGDALAYVREQLEKIGAAGKLSELFGDQQVLDFVIPFMANVDEYLAIKEQVAQATGAALDPDFYTQLGGLNRQMIRFKEIGIQAGRVIGLAFGQNLPGLNDRLEQLLNWIRELDKSSGGMVSKVLSFAGMAIIAATALGALGLVLPIVGAGIGMVGAAAALMLSPIGLLIGALAAGGAYIYKNWDRFGPRLKRLWESTKSAFRGLSDRVVGLGRRMIDGARELAATYGPYVVERLRSAWQTISDGARAAGPRLREAFNVAWEGAAFATDNFVSGFRQNSGELGSTWSNITAEWSKSIGHLRQIGADLGQIIGNMFGKIELPAGVTWSDIFQEMGRGFADAVQMVSSHVQSLSEGLNRVLEGITKITGALANGEPIPWSDILPVSVIWIANLIGGAVEWVANAVRKVIDAFSNLAVNWQALLPDWVSTTANAIATSVNAAAAAVSALKNVMGGMLSPDGKSALPGDILPNGTIMTPDNDGRDAAADDFLKGPPMPPKPRAGVDGGTRFAAVPASPVRLDGNVAVTVRVEGPGKVASVTSDNDRIRVGSNGRMVGSV